METSNPIEGITFEKFVSDKFNREDKNKKTVLLKEEYYDLAEQYAILVNKKLIERVGYMQFDIEALKHELNQHKK